MSTMRTLVPSIACAPGWGGPSNWRHPVTAEFALGVERKPVTDSQLGAEQFSRSSEADRERNGD